MKQISLIVAGEGEPRRYPDLEALGRDLLALARTPDLGLSRITASYPGEASGFAAIKVVTPAGDWIATAAIQGRTADELARAVGRAAAKAAA